MDAERILAPDHLLRLESLVVEDEVITATLCATQPACACPQCGDFSARIHSRYRRTLADLPWATRGVVVHLLVRKFFCAAPQCSRRIFTERLPDYVAPYARRTCRLTAGLQRLALALGGEAGARLANQLCILTSPDTLLRTIHQLEEPDQPPPRVVGVDDWAWRKGSRYGTIIVDLERRKVIDLLPDRTSEALASWLRAHPGILVVSRDRARTYAEGVRQGAPEALQVIDRWHLLHNLRDILTRVLDRRWGQLRRSVVTTGLGPTHYASVSANELRAKHDRQARRRMVYDEVIALHGQGLTQEAIAQRMGVHRHTVRRFIKAGSFPAWAPRGAVPMILDDFIPYLQQRWREGCRKGVQLCQELDARGFKGSNSTVLRYVRYLKLATAAGEIPPAPPDTSPLRRASVREVVWAMLCRPAERDTTQQQLLAQLCEASPEVAQAHALSQEFQRLIRQRDLAGLEPWQEQAIRSQIPELRAFAVGLRREWEAIATTLCLPWSNGPVEGHIHRLKLLKRQMYGRAKFDLLRKRVILAG